MTPTWLDKFTTYRTTKPQLSSASSASPRLSNQRRPLDDFPDHLLQFPFRNLPWRSVHASSVESTVSSREVQDLCHCWRCQNEFITAEHSDGKPPSVVEITKPFFTSLLME
jgi:hypothetical protein